jgi:cytochrome oxidase Cu insertion factor (SCO1/SenC/PrrC family)
VEELRKGEWSARAEEIKKNACGGLAKWERVDRLRWLMRANDLEPVEVDPKVLRRTAWILVVVMVLGGSLILIAYQKMAREVAKDTRPSYVTQISERKDLLFKRQDGELAELKWMKGKVVVVQSVPRADVDELTTGVMRRLAERYKERDDFELVTLMLDAGGQDEVDEELKDLAEKLGAELPKWTVGTNEQETLHKFIKNEFKANLLPYEKDGKWKYDGSLVLIDKDRHVRRAVVPQERGGAPYVTGFDFQQAAGWDRDEIKTGTEFTNVEEMERLLIKTVEILLEESAEKGK